MLGAFVTLNFNNQLKISNFLIPNIVFFIASLKGDFLSLKILNSGEKWLKIWKHTQRGPWYSFFSLLWSLAFYIFRCFSCCCFYNICRVTGFEPKILQRQTELHLHQQKMTKVNTSTLLIFLTLPMKKVKKSALE